MTYQRLRDAAKSLIEFMGGVIMLLILADALGWL